MYLGHEIEAIVSQEVYSIWAGCFNFCDSLVSVKFESDSKPSNLGEHAFRYCPSLESIVIPSIRAIPIYEALSDWTIERGARVSNFWESAFQRCLSLESICIPSSTEGVSGWCYSPCFRLSALTFESGCKLDIDSDHLQILLHAL
jgi:hypothetical protein